MKRFILAALTVAAVGLAAVPAEAQRGKMTSTWKVGVEPSVGGSFQGGGTGSIWTFPARIEERGWTDTHDMVWPWIEGGLGLGIADGTEIMVNFEYGRANSKPVEFGAVNNTQISAEYRDLEYWGINGGLRFVLTNASTAPYLFASGGFRDVQALTVDLSAPSVGQNRPNVSFYDSSSVPTFGFGGGLLFGGGRVKFGVEASVRYTAGLDHLNGFEGTQLEHINSTGERWSVPIAAVFRF